eukprot:1195279-Prorocentrum_minimum.AAC.2
MKHVKVHYSTPAVRALLHMLHECTTHEACEGALHYARYARAVAGTPYAADTAGIRELMVKTPSSRPLGSFWRPPRLNRYQVAQEIYTFLYEGEVQVRQAPESTAKKAVDFNSTVDCRH